MNFQAMLDEILNAGQGLTQELSKKAQNMTGVPENGTERSAMLSGLGKGAAATAVIGLLLGTKSGRKLGSSAIKLGGLAALGGVAYKAYQNWQNNQASEAEKSQYQFEEHNQRSQQQIEQNSKVILRAMLMAAKADGNIDQKEQQTILDQIGQVDPQTQVWLEKEINAPIDLNSLAGDVGEDTALAAEVYLASRMVVGDVSHNEQAHLNELANKLHIPLALIQQVEQEVDKA